MNHFCHFSTLTEIRGLRHAITTRHGGSSTQSFHSLNLGFHVDDDANRVRENREIVARNLGFDAKNLTAAQQTHSANIEIVTHENRVHENLRANFDEEKRETKIRERVEEAHVSPNSERENHQNNILEIERERENLASKSRDGADSSFQKAERIEIGQGNLEREVFESENHNQENGEIGDDKSGNRGRGALDWESALPETDALITREIGAPLLILVADCAPLLFVDSANRVLAVVHAGWRGAVARIASKTVARMQREFGTRAEDLRVGIGPCLCAKCFEIGDDVAKIAHEIAPQSVISGNVFQENSIGIARATSQNDSANSPKNFDSQFENLSLSSAKNETESQFSDANFREIVTPQFVKTQDLSAEKEGESTTITAHSSLEISRDSEKPHLDLRELLREDLRQVRVLDSQIETLSNCPRCEVETFFSHRGENGKTGRFGVVAWWEN